MEGETTETAAAEPAPLYDQDLQMPAADAPLRDLPPRIRPIFEALRKACLTVPGVVERVRHEGPVWKWIWAYERDGRTVCAIHPMQEGVDLSLPVPTRFEPYFEKAELDADILQAISKGETAARVRYVRMSIPDPESVPRLFRAVEMKLTLQDQDQAGTLGAEAAS